MNDPQVKIIRKNIAHFAVKIVSIFVLLIVVSNIFSVPFFSVAMLFYVVLITISIAVWTAKEVVIIDFGNNTIRDGTRILGMSQMDSYSFSGLEKIFFNKIKTKSELRQLATTTTIHDELYKAFLKTNEGDKICVAIDKNKEQLIKKLKRLNERLKVPVFDNTESVPVQID